MDKMAIQGGVALKGEVEVNGAKNSALPLIFSTLLAPGTHQLENVPRLQDVYSACALMESLGVQTQFQGGLLKIQVESHLDTLAHYDQVRKMRASILVLGPLLARLGEVRVSLPGGCAIGSRPIDMHLEALKKMGARVEVEGGYVVARSPRLQGARIDFPFPTVGGTENIMMAACLAQGTTEINNAAREPEVEDLALYLGAMGAKIQGAGSSHIRIEGRGDLQALRHRVIGDRIEAGTLLAAGAITGGEVTVRGSPARYMEAFIQALGSVGCEVQGEGDCISLAVGGPLRPTDIETAPYPGFPTDLQAQMMALLTQAQGESRVTENVFENRFMHIAELTRLGAVIQVQGSKARVFGGGKKLHGASVMATDLRASASLILAGLVAQGETLLHRLYHLDRGYENLEEKISSLGGKIQRIKG